MRLLQEWGARGLGRRALAPGTERREGCRCCVWALCPRLPLLGTGNDLVCVSRNGIRRKTEAGSSFLWQVGIAGMLGPGLAMSYWWALGEGECKARNSSRPGVSPGPWCAWMQPKHVNELGTEDTDTSQPRLGSEI